MLDSKLQSHTDWTVGAVMHLPERNNYAYRITLKYQDGRKIQQQKSGFKTKKEAEMAKQRTIGELIPFLGNLHWQMDFTFCDDKNKSMARTGAKNLQIMKKITTSILQLVK